MSQRNAGRVGLLCVLAAVVMSVAPAFAAAPERGPARVLFGFGSGVVGGGSAGLPLREGAVRVGEKAPEFVGLGRWFNSEPLRLADLRGQVVLVNFWTFDCYNCANTLPSMRDWYAKYGGRGLVMIGIHTPEFSYEHDPANVEQALGRLGVAWPVAQDNDYATWNAYNTRYWPTKWLIDATGTLRDLQIGEGNYDGTEQLIRQLLQEAGYSPTSTAAPAGAAAPRTGGA